MNKREVLRSLAEQNNGIIRTADAALNGISRPTFAAFVEENGYRRVMRGVYCSPDSWIDGMYLLQMKRPSAIFSHETALFLHGLTDRDPLFYTVTMKNGSNPNGLTDQGICVYTVKKELFDIGITTTKTPYGNDVQVYNIERTICDIIRKHNRMDAQVFSEALNKYVRRKDKDLERLMEYACDFNVDQTMRQYMQVLL